MSVEQAPHGHVQHRRRINNYVCTKCPAVTVTEDVDEGVTPFYINCPAEGCDGQGRSMFYQGHVASPVTFQFYRPSWFRRLFLIRIERDHVEQGGLLMRKV